MSSADSLRTANSYTAFCLLGDLPEALYESGRPWIAVGSVSRSQELDQAS